MLAVENQHGASYNPPRSVRHNLTTVLVRQSALFNFQSLLLVILLLICTCTYVRAVAPRLIDRNKEGCVHHVTMSLSEDTR